MENKEKILKALKTLRYLIDKEKEYMGYINLGTGVITELIEGEETIIRIDPEEIKTKGIEGWTLFHSHSKKSPSGGKWEIKPGPSDLDQIIANISGLPNYLIDAMGIWEIKPKTSIPRETIEQAWLEAKEFHPHFVLEELKRKFPIDISLLYQWPE